MSLGLVLALSWFHHPASACDHPEVVSLPVAGALGCLEESSSASMRASGSSFASGCTYLRFNIEGPAKPKIGTPMPKLVLLKILNNQV